jgi:hypothetical protein
MSQYIKEIDLPSASVIIASSSPTTLSKDGAALSKDGGGMILVKPVEAP